jgi:hypothetical protein
MRIHIEQGMAVNPPDAGNALDICQFPSRAL